jgi:hypothetical protein
MKMKIDEVIAIGVVVLLVAWGIWSSVKQNGDIRDCIRDCIARGGVPVIRHLAYLGCAQERPR